MVTKIKNQEIEIVSLNDGYANLTEYLPKLGEIIAFNKVDFSRLPTIKVPTGGNTSFNVTDLDGEHAEPEVLGVVVNWQEYRVFWEKALDDPEGGSGQSPDCYSTGAITGSLTVAEINRFAQSYELPLHRDREVNALATCNGCPFAQMGTAKQGKGRGQWCKSRLHIYVLLPQTVLPYVISVPPKSLKPVLNYFTYLSVKGLPAFGVISSFKLTAEKNADNIKYSQIRPLKAKELSSEEAQVMREYHEAIKPYLTAITGSLIQDETAKIDPDTGEIEEQP